MTGATKKEEDKMSTNKKKRYEEMVDTYANGNISIFKEWVRKTNKRNIRRDSHED